MFLRKECKRVINKIYATAVPLKMGILIANSKPASARILCPIYDHFFLKKREIQIIFFAYKRIVVKVEITI